MNPRRRRLQRSRKLLRSTVVSYGFTDQLPAHPVSQLVVRVVPPGRVGSVALYRYRNGGFVGAGWEQ